MKSADLPLDPKAYVAHDLHRGEHDWLETNCYVDVWIELLHAHDFDPVAGLGFCVRTDLEADQWTFFKYSHEELFSLYGLDVIELNPWQSVITQVVNEVRAGNVPLVEVDAYYLPDTIATTFHTSHGKTTIGVIAINVDASCMTYLHSGGLFSVSGLDFRALFSELAPTPGHVVLPPYIEVVKRSTGEALRGSALVSEAVRLLRKNVARIPKENPFVRYADRFPEDVFRLRGCPAEEFHRYAFATFRQFGAAFSLASMHLEWLRFLGPDVGSIDEAIKGFATISATAKNLQFRAARAILAQKTVDVSPQLNQLVQSWEEATSSLRSALG